MRVLRVVLIGLCFLCSVAASAQKEDWLPIGPEDLQVKEVPGSPGASAIQLYYADYIDDENQSEFFYHRIKVLNEKGNKYADIEIEVPIGGAVNNLKARTIHPDGHVIEFTGKPFQKTIVKTRGVKVTAQTFTMPEVTPGSIIEYKYKLDWREILAENFWTIQHSLYTVKENFRMKPYQHALADFPYGYQVTASYARMPKDLKPERKTDFYELEAHDIPAFEAEGYMPPEEDFKPQVRFFYISSGMTKSDKFWEEIGQSWQSEADHFIGNHREVAEAASQAMSGESDTEKKLRRLYGRAQRIRNLSYERERSEQERKQESLKDNQHSGDVVNRGYGYRNDITRTFVALARSAGFQAWIVRVNNRKERFFSRNVLSRRQLDDEIALVNVGDKELYLDPGTPFCPFGMVRWVYTSTAGLKLEKKIGNFITVPPFGPDKAIVRRTANLHLQPSGTLKGELVVQFQGADALELRLDALTTDDAGKRKNLEDEMYSILPSGSVAKVVKVQGWDATEEPLIATFDVQLSNFASFAGKRLLMPAYLIQAKQFDAFKHADRKFPVYFPYPFAEFDNFTVELPPGTVVESVPPRQDVALPYARYQSLSQSSGTIFNNQRALYLSGMFFPIDKYSEVKDFFNKVQAGDEQQAVMHGGNVSAQN
jgi:Domain of Unknown Function with PDB structure (DUF3857)